MDEEIKKAKLYFNAGLKCLDVDIEISDKKIDECLDTLRQDNDIITGDDYLYISLILLSCYYDESAFYTTQFSELFTNYSNKRLIDILLKIHTRIYK